MRKRLGRQDGTRAYYFSVEQLHTMWSAAGFEEWQPGGSRPLDPPARPRRARWFPRLGSLLAPPSQSAVSAA